MGAGLEADRHEGRTAGEERETEMQADSLPSMSGRDRVYAELKDRGLLENLSEFETFGYTVIPPEKVGMPEVFERMRDRVLEIATERTGVEHTLDGDVSIGKLKSVPQKPNQIILYYLLTEDPAFRTAITHPVARLMLSTVLGQRFHISSVSAFVKSKGDSYGPTLGLHSDSGDFSDPLPGTYAHNCNTNWLLTDYKAEHGPLAVVPGSHRWCRKPRRGEGADLAVPVEGKAGSLIVFHGNLWHGGLPKETDGLRLSVNANFARPYAAVQENYRGKFGAKDFEEHGEWFAQLVGERTANGWTDGNGPDPEKYLAGAVIL